MSADAGDPKRPFQFGLSTLLWITTATAVALSLAKWAGDWGLFWLIVGIVGGFWAYWKLLSLLVRHALRLAPGWWTTPAFVLLLLGPIFLGIMLVHLFSILQAAID